MSIHKKFNILFARGGTCRSERLLPELIDNHLLISDKQLSDHLRFLYLYTDLLAYYDTNNERIEQNIWRKFLEQDDTVIRSLILHTNIDRLKKSIHKDFLTLRRNNTGIAQNKYIVRILVVAQELIILLEYWHKNLSHEDIIRAKLDAIIHKELNTHISGIYHVLRQHHKFYKTQSYIDFCTFLDQKFDYSSLWELKADLIETKLGVPAFTDQDAINILDDFFNAIFNTIYKLKELSSVDYFDTLKSRNKEPHVALLIAFLQLLQYADDHLNHIPQRALDHYYRHILKFNNNPAIQDQAYIHFLLSSKCCLAFVPKGSRLVAKNPVNGENILFETQKNITVNKAKINQIHTLLSTKKSNKNGYKTIELSAATYNKEILKGFPFQVFPAPQNNDIGKEQQQLAIIIGSPLLYLAEGTRTIYIKWKLTAESYQELINRNPNKELSITLFLKELVAIFSAMFYIQITTKDGWLSIPKDAVVLEFNHQEHFISMTIILNPEIPSIEKLVSGCQDKVVNPSTPALFIGICDTVSLIGLYFLNGLVVENIDLKVSVQQYRGLILQNELGVIDNSQIFEPFGPLAKLDSSFYIGSGEIFSKNLTSLKIEIKWEGIPTVEGGFKRYYDSYPSQVQNDDFKVNISYLNHQHWNPSYLQNRQSVPLFQLIKNNETEQLDYLRTISDIDIAALAITKANEPLDLSVYGPKTVAGFLKLKLNMPEQAFGHTIYPSLMSSILVKNAQKKQGEEIIILNEPYTPRIKSITAAYEAAETIVLTVPSGEEEKYLNSFFHISSFGYSKVFPSNLANPATLLPFIEEQASFIAFGIEDLNSRNFSMHIAFGDNFLNPDKEVEKPKWFYMLDNLWLSFDETMVVDGTDGCVKSGIIVFDLGNVPSDATTNNTYMRSGLTWIKAQFMSEIDALPIIVGAYMQAVDVVRIMDKNGVFSAPRLSPRTIHHLQYPIDGIASVVQPFQTFSGRQFENHQAFYRRVSERLRHKNRAVSVWDYERIVLEKFPEIFRVKCINHTVKRTNNIISPGCITLVVIPQVGQGPISMLPIVSKQLLAEIKAYVQSVSSPFVKCEVVNPVCEDVKVNVTVKFKPGYERGLFLNVLQQDLCNLLSPWLSNTLADIQLGGDIPISKIIDFINNRYYIEGVGNFSIFKYTGTPPNVKFDRIKKYDSYLFAGYPWSVMVSAKNHKISVVDKFDAAVKLRHGGVGDMAISEDFVVGPSEEHACRNFVEYPNGNIPIASLEEYCLITKKYIKTNHGNH